MTYASQVVFTLKKKGGRASTHTHTHHQRATALVHCEAVFFFFSLPNLQAYITVASLLTPPCLPHTNCYTIKYSVLVVVLHRPITQLYSL